MLDLEFEGATSEKIFTVGEHAGEDVAELLTRYLYTPTPRRMFALPLALRHGYTVAEVHDITGIDAWFLQRIKHIVDIEQELRSAPELDSSRLRALKQMGISDKRIGELVGKSGLEIRAL